MKNYTFEHTAKNEANILINGEIDSFWNVGLQDLAAEIKESKAERLNIQINSPGGSVTEGGAIADFIKGYKKPVNTSGFGLVASIATKILLAGDVVSMAKGSYFMIHQPWAAIGGEAEDLRQTAGLLDKMKAELVQTYLQKISENGKLIDGSEEKTQKQIEKWVENETWFTASEAYEAGFIDKVTEGVEFLNKSNYKNIYNSTKNFKNVPVKLLNQFKTFATMQDKTEETKETFFEKVKAWFVSNPAEAEKLTADIQAQKQADKQAEIEKAILIAKENGFYLDAESTAEAPAEQPNFEGVEITPEDEALTQAETPTEVISFEAETQQEEEGDLQAEVKQLKAALKELEEAACSPSAGAGEKLDTEKASIEALIAPTKKHKEFMNFFGSIFQ
tara:strand:+ start:10692 stop:11864 length:1173 start_codon:yes stop_codon:yes gene_type:complete